MKHRNGLDRENNDTKNSFSGAPNTKARSCRGRGRTAGASAEVRPAVQHASHPSREALTATGPR